MDRGVHAWLSVTRAHVGALFPVGGGGALTLDERLWLFISAVVVTASMAVVNLLQSDWVWGFLYAAAVVAALSALGLQLWLNITFAKEPRPKVLKTLTGRYRAAVPVQCAALTFWLVVSVGGLVEAADAISVMFAHRQLLDALYLLGKWVAGVAVAGWLLNWTASSISDIRLEYAEMAARIIMDEAVAHSAEETKSDRRSIDLKDLPHPLRPLTRGCALILIDAYLEGDDSPIGRVLTEYHNLPFPPRGPLHRKNFSAWNRAIDHVLLVDAAMSRQAVAEGDRRKVAARARVLLKDANW